MRSHNIRSSGDENVSVAAMNCCFSHIRPYQHDTAVEHMTISRTLFTAFYCSVRLNERENHFFVPQRQDPTNLLRVSKTSNYKLLCIHNWKSFETCFLACFLHLIPPIAFSLFSEVSSTHSRRFAVLNEKAIRLFNVSKAEVEKAKRLGLKLLSRHSPKPADQARVQT